MEDQFRDELGHVFELTERPGPATLRIRLTLTGAAPTSAVLGPLSRFDLAAGTYNAYQSLRGREGTLTGYVIYAAEIYDSTDDTLLLAEITKQFPDPVKISASFGALNAPMAGIRKGARDLRTLLSSAPIR